jgi:lipid-A-disaccharide synthase
MIIAGEASGDMHAAEFLECLKKKRPDIRAFGMGGTKMQAAGIELLVDANEISVMGFLEVLMKYRQLKKTLAYLQKELLQRKPELLVLVDFVEFNLKLAETARQAGIRVLFYVSPQIWAWRPSRIHKIGKKIDMMTVIFPFEVQYYKDAGIPVRYVGHPLVDQLQKSSENHQPIETDRQGPVIALLPGSRRGEINQILPAMLEAAELLREKHKTIKFLLPVAHTLTREELSPCLNKHPSLPLEVFDGRSHDVIAAADAVISTSGTATLEIALMGKPMAIVYKTSWLSYILIRPLVRIDFAGLPNIVAGKLIVKEFIQQDAQPEAIASEIDRILTDDAYQSRMRNNLREVKEKLGKGGGSERLAQVADEMLDGKIISE